MPISLNGGIFGVEDNRSNISCILHFQLIPISKIWLFWLGFQVEKTIDQAQELGSSFFDVV